MSEEAGTQGKGALKISCFGQRVSWSGQNDEIAMHVVLFMAEGVVSPCRPVELHTTCLLAYLDSGHLLGHATAFLSMMQSTVCFPVCIRTIEQGVAAGAWDGGLSFIATILADHVMQSTLHQGFSMLLGTRGCNPTQQDVVVLLVQRPGVNLEGFTDLLRSASATTGRLAMQKTVGASLGSSVRVLPKAWQEMLCSERKEIANPGSLRRFDRQ